MRPAQKAGRKDNEASRNNEECQKDSERKQPKNSTDTEVEKSDFREKESAPNDEQNEVPKK